MDIETSTTESRHGLAEAQVILKARKARPFFGRHPWVLDSAVDHVDGQPADGAVVDLIAQNGKFVARGIYNSQSRIRVRLYTWAAGDALDPGFLANKDRAGHRPPPAIGLRRHRRRGAVVYSEADGLSGLIVDRYGQYLVVQVTSLAMQSRVDELLPVLAEATGARGVVVRADRTLAKLEGLAKDEERTWGDVPEGLVFVAEHGLRYGVELGLGQKTGFYLDQRENRRAVANYVRGATCARSFLLHRRVQSGGITPGGAAEVLGIDSSDKAVALARAGAELNSVTNVRFETADGFDALDALVSDRERFDVVILDPPKFTRTRRSVEDALRLPSHQPLWAPRCCRRAERW